MRYDELRIKINEIIYGKNEIPHEKFHILKLAQHMEVALEKENVSSEIQKFHFLQGVIDNQSIRSFPITLYKIVSTFVFWVLFLLQLIWWRTHDVHYTFIYICLQMIFVLTRIFEEAI